MRMKEENEPFLSSIHRGLRRLLFGINLSLLTKFSGSNRLR